jgi:glycerol uptake facilitator-like aquaporin
MSQYTSEDDPLMGLEETIAPQQTRRRAKTSKKQHGSPSQSSGRAVRAVIAELIGSFFLAFITIAGIAIAAFLTDDAIDVARILVTSLMYGLTYGILVYALSFDNEQKPNIRHLNPAVTLAMLVRGALSPALAATYMLAQYLGAWTAVFIVIHTLPPPAQSFTLTGSGFLNPAVLISGVDLSHQIGASILVGTFFIVIASVTLYDFVTLPLIPDETYALVTSTGVEVSEEHRPQSPHEVNTLVFMFTAVVCSALLAPISQDYMNPAMGMVLTHMTGAWYWAPCTIPFITALVAGVVTRGTDYQADLVQTYYGESYTAVNGGSGRNAPKSRARRQQARNVQMTPVYAESNDFDV